MKAIKNLITRIFNNKLYKQREKSRLLREQARKEYEEILARRAAEAEEQRKAAMEREKRRIEWWSKAVRTQFLRSVAAGRGCTVEEVEY